jgi:hypothetical protein
VVDLAGSTDASMELLLDPVVALQGVGVKQITSLSGESQGTLLAPEIDGGDKALVAEVANGIVVGVEILFEHDSERADGRQGAAVLAIQFVHTVAIEHELAVFAAR